MTNRFCVHYRTGGIANFRWNTTFESLDTTAAHDMAAQIRRMGYPTKIVPVGAPLPTSYEG
ncbi:hypothetical protein [Magnetospirillum molischianum]|uniref:Uncharacterized protein n=1 Tax=Magnetospirillum molischianum DSM 120 TaxID=1150626 RepID=H8FXZ0_MAGML|nr:hypothetical protein [Magnetospirillum molischianum]CCG43228.1 hypothetical protein PHAMO_80019 [Magnetospirillum molischianum DSM 120]